MIDTLKGEAGDWFVTVLIHHNAYKGPDDWTGDVTIDCVEPNGHAVTTTVPGDRFCLLTQDLGGYLNAVRRLVPRPAVKEIDPVEALAKAMLENRNKRHPYGGRQRGWEDQGTRKVYLTNAKFCIDTYGVPPSEQKAAEKATPLDHNVPVCDDSIEALAKRIHGFNGQHHTDGWGNGPYGKFVQEAYRRMARGLISNGFVASAALVEEAEKMLRFVAGLSLSRATIVEQRQQRERVYALQRALRPEVVDKKEKAK